MTQRCQFFQEDARELHINHPNAFDIITSNGLNIYIENDEEVTRLYSSFYNALKPGGTLIGSALSCPPGTPNSEWVLSKIEPNAIQLQRAVFLHLLQATWSNFRSSTQTIAQLNSAGFDSIQIYWDDAHLFYTFEAQKPFTSGCG